MLKTSSLLKTFILITALQVVAINANPVTINMPAAPALGAQLTDGMLSDSQSKKPEALGKALLLAALQVLSKVGNTSINGFACNTRTIADFLNSRAYANVKDFCVTEPGNICYQIQSSYNFHTDAAPPLSFRAIQNSSPIKFISHDTTTGKEQAIVFACLTLMHAGHYLLFHKGSYSGNAAEFHKAIIRSLAALEIIFDNCAEQTSCYINEKGNICAGANAVFKLAVNPTAFSDQDDDLCTVRMNKNLQLYSCLKTSAATGAPEYALYLDSENKDVVLSKGPNTIQAPSRWARLKAWSTGKHAFPKQISQPIIDFPGCMLPISQLETHNKDLLVLVALHRALTSIKKLLVGQPKSLPDLLDAVVPQQRGPSKVYSDSALHIAQEHTDGCSPCFVEVRSLLHSLFGIELVEGRSIRAAARRSKTQMVKEGVTGTLGTGISMGLAAAAYWTAIRGGLNAHSSAALALATGMSFSQAPGLSRFPRAVASGVMGYGPEQIIDAVPVYKNALRNIALTAGVAGTSYASLNYTFPTLVAASAAVPAYVGYKALRAYQGKPCCRRVEYGTQVPSSPLPTPPARRHVAPAGAGVGAPVSVLAQPPAQGAHRPAAPAAHGLMLPRAAAPGVPTPAAIGLLAAAPVPAVEAQGGEAVKLVPVEGRKILCYQLSNGDLTCSKCSKPVTLEGVTAPAAWACTCP